MGSPTNGTPLNKRPNQRRQSPRILAFALVATVLSGMPVDAFAKEPKFAWTKFIQVTGQPEPVPQQWVSTPEGRFAHSIRIPNPVPKDSGYRRGMTSKQYFEHLCRTEAGEFIFKTVENVDGFYFMRPPGSPTDDDIQHRYKLEDPYTERYYQLVSDRIPNRPAQFVSPPFHNYIYVEEPRRNIKWQTSVSTPYVKFSGYRFDGKEWRELSEMRMEEIEKPVSRYAYTWRGLKRPRDRELAIAGSELIILDHNTGDVLAVLRNFAISPRARNTSDQIWWLNARSCPQFPVSYRDNLGQQIYQFVSKVLFPAGANN